MPAHVRATRRVDVRGPKAEVVSARDSGAISVNRRTPRRPIVADDASVPKSTSRYRQIDPPAAHEVKKRVLFGIKVDSYYQLLYTTYPCYSLEPTLINFIFC